MESEVDSDEVDVQWTGGVCLGGRTEELRSG